MADTQHTVLYKLVAELDSNALASLKRLADTVRHVEELNRQEFETTAQMRRILANQELEFEITLSAAANKRQHDDRKRALTEQQRDERQAAREREELQLRSSKLAQDIVDKQVNVAQKGLSAITQLSRSVALAFTSQNAELEGAVRSLANFEAIAQGFGGVMDLIETGTQWWKLYRLEVEAATLAQKGLAAANVASTVTGLASGAGGAGGAGGAAGGLGMLGSLGSAALSLGPLALGVGGIAAILMSLEKPKDNSRELRSEMESQHANRIAVRNMYREGGMRSLEGLNADPASLMSARDSIARNRLGSVSDLTREADAIAGGYSNGRFREFSKSEWQRVTEERGNRTSADYSESLEGARELVKLRQEELQLGLQGIRERIQADEAAVAHYRSIMEQAQDKLSGAQRSIADMSPAERSKLKRTAAAIESGGAGSLKFGDLKQYDSVFNTRFADDAAARDATKFGFDPYLKGLRGAVSRSTTDYGTAFTNLSEDTTGAMVGRKIEVESDVEVNVTVSLAEADVIDKIVPRLKEAQVTLEKALTAAATNAAKERGAVNAKGTAAGR